MNVNMPVQVMNEKCLNCPELEIDIYTKEKLDMKRLSEGHTISAIIGFENVLKCKNWDEANGTCPVICRYQAIVKAVIKDAADKIVESAIAEEKSPVTIKKPATKKAEATKKPAAKKPATKKATTKK